MTDAATATDAPAAMFLIIPVGKEEPEAAWGEEEFLDHVLDDARVHKTMTVTAMKLVERVKNHPQASRPDTNCSGARLLPERAQA